MPLTSKQVRALRAEAHRLKLKPVVIIGQKGLSDNVSNEIQQALDHHELVKIRLPALERADKSAMLDDIAARMPAELIQTVGHVAVFFRRNPDSQRFVKLLQG